MNQSGNQFGNTESQRKAHRLDDLSQKLYSPNSPDIVNKKARPLTPLTDNVPHAWQEEEKQEEVEYEVVKPSSKGAWFFFTIAFLFSVASFAFAWYYIVNKADVANKVDVAVTGPVSTPAGTEYPIEVRITNTNSFPLELVDLVVEFPSGTMKADIPDQEMGTYREGLGDIDPGVTVVRNISAILFGKSQEEQKITARAVYRIPNSNAIFDKTKEIGVLLETGPVEFALDTLDESILGQETTLTLRIRSNTDAPITDMLVRAEYPQGFSFVESWPEPTYDENGWLVKVIEPRQTKEIKIRGVFNGEINTDRFVRFTAGVPDQFDNKSIANIYASSLEKVSIVKPFLSARLIFKDGENVGAGELVKGTIEWQNNSGGPLTDVGIELNLSGTALNRKIISAEKGFFRSTENKIVWNKTTNPEFTKIDDGQTGTVDFEFGTFKFEEYSSLTKNPEVNLDLSLSARRPTQSGVPEEIKSTANAKIKVESKLAFKGKSLYYIGPFTNSGPLPPVPETDTTYTIVWTLTNTSNDMSNVQVTAYLPPYMKWNNKISPISDRVTFDETTRKITWNAGNVSAGTGTSKSSREVAFQVTLFPSSNQEGEMPSLISKIAFSGKDTFTGQEISDDVDNDITTRMPNDPNFVASMEKVGGE